MGLGAAATNALWDFMAQQEKDRRQKFVDALAGRAADRADKAEERQARQDEMAHQERTRQLDINERTMNIQEAAAKRAAAQAEVEGAKRTAETTPIGASLDTGAADQLRRANMGGMIRVGQADPAAMEQASVSDPALAQVDMERQFGGRPQSFGGTPQQQMLQQYIGQLRMRQAGGDASAKVQADALEAQLMSGDTSFAASLFTGPQAKTFTSRADGRATLRDYYTGEPIRDLGALPRTTADVLAEAAGQTGPLTDFLMSETRKRLDTVESLAGPLTTGAAGSVIGMLPGTDAYQMRETVQSTLGTIASTMLFEISTARAQTGNRGSGFGQLTERELKLLESMLGPLSQGMSNENLKKSIKDIRGSLDRWEAAKAQYAVDPRTFKPGKEDLNTKPAAAGPKPAVSVQAPAADGGWTVVDGVKIRERKP